MDNLYDVARAITDEVMGAGVYAEINKNNLDPGVQAAIRRAPREPNPPEENGPKENQ